MADETTEEIEIATRERPTLPKPPSAWKVGLMFTLGAGPFAGLATGLIQRNRNKSYLEAEANTRLEKNQLRDVLDSELKVADPDEKRLLEYAKGVVADGYERLAIGDSSGEKLIAEARELLKGVITGDIQARKQEVAAERQYQRQLIGDSAKGYRMENQTTIDAYNAIEHQSMKVLDLVAQPDFDPNKPLNKAHLADLLSMGGLMFKDTPDMMDGITQGVSAFSDTAGGVVGGIATMMKSDDFKVSADDYNKLALNAKKYASIYATRKLEQLASQAGSLDVLGKRLGVIPEDYSLQNYISGGESELRFTPDPVVSAPSNTGSQTRSAPPPTQNLINGWGTRGMQRRPTN